MRRKISFAISIVILFVLLLISFSLNWIGANFGGISFDEIVFHLSMPLKGAANGYLASYAQKTLLPALGVTIEAVIGAFLVRTYIRMVPNLRDKIVGSNLVKWIYRNRWICGLLIAVIWLGGESYRAQRWFGFFDYIKSFVQRTQIYEEEYVDPISVKIVFPEKKRNLIFIMMESAESSTQDRENGGLMPVNYIPEMTQIAINNISFSQSEKIEGASVAPLCGWTMAGMLAETAGVPLKLYGVHKSLVEDPEYNYEEFMPGVYSIGEILESEGYHNVFMAGSDFEFGGRLLYCSSHGNYEILDYYKAIEQGIIPEDYMVWWGMEDQKLYGWAKEELLKLAEEGQPFNFTLLTVDTHSQDGYICSLCRNEYSDPYANVWRCASRQVEEFLTWIQAQDFYEDTTVVIVGDHCSMDRDFYGTYENGKYDGGTVRKVYNAFINSPVKPVKEKNRLFTTLDFYPTTLAALGCTIEGERLGMGVNLFSGEQTLSEKYGYDEFFEEMQKTSLFYDKKLIRCE